MTEQRLPTLHYSTAPRRLTVMARVALALEFVAIVPPCVLLVSIAAHRPFWLQRLAFVMNLFGCVIGVPLAIAAMTLAGVGFRRAQRAGTRTRPYLLLQLIGLVAIVACIASGRWVAQILAGFR